MSKLLQLIDHRAALSLLGAEVHTSNIPGKGSCPLCQQDRSLQIYQDQLTAGHYVYCSSCAASGDLIELACKKWNVPTVDAIRRLSPALPTNRTGTMRLSMLHVQYAERCASSLSDIDLGAMQTKSAFSFEALKFFNRSGIQIDTRLPWADQGIPEYLGYMSADKAERVLAGKPLVTHRKTRAGIRTHLPATWDNVLVSRVEDYPGRTVGYLFNGLESGRLTQQYFPRSIARRTRASGFVIHPSLYSAKQLIVTNNFEIMLRLHARGLQRDRNPPPIVTAVTDANHAILAWNRFNKTDLVFWAYKPDAQVFWQAITCGGRVSIAGPRQSGQSFRDFFSSREADRVTDMIFEAAKPWPEAVSLLVDRLDDTDLGVFASSLQATPEEYERIYESCNKTQRRRLKRCVEKHLSWTGVSIGAGTVEQRSGAMYYVSARGEQQLVNCIFTVDKIVRYRRQASVRMHVTCIFRGKEYQFAYPEAEFRSNPLGCLSTSLGDIGAGTLAYLKNWQQRVLQAVLTIRQPRIVNESGFVGCQAEKRRFLLPANKITATEIKSRGLADAFPSMPRTRKPRYLGHENLKDLPESLKMALVSALDVTVRPLFGESQAPLLFAGTPAPAVTQQLAGLLGFGSVTHDAHRTDPSRGELSNYPELATETLDLGCSQIKWRRAMIENSCRPVICVGNEMQKHWVGLTGGVGVTLESVSHSLDRDQERRIVGWWHTQLQQALSTEESSVFLRGAAKSLGLAHRETGRQGRLDAAHCLGQLIRTAKELGLIKYKRSKKPISTVEPVRLSDVQCFIPIGAPAMILRKLKLPAIDQALLQLRISQSRHMLTQASVGSYLGWMFSTKITAKNID